MLIKRCHKTFTVEITVLISDGKRFVLTAFMNAVAYFFGEGVQSDLATREDTIFSMEDVDFQINPKKIIVGFKKHGE